MEIPGDMYIFGGVSLAGALSAIAKVLFTNGFFLKYKKFTGIGLIAAGILLALGYTYSAGANGFYSYFLAGITGLSAGLSAVGMQSTVKNAIEGMTK